MAKKVYCNTCSHLNYPECYAPGNIQEFDTWHKRKKEPKDSPKVLNRENNCAMYRSREEVGKAVDKVTA